MMKDILVMLLAAFVTIGVFILLGYTPKVFYAYLAMIVIMYFYTTTEKIEDTLFKVIVFISFTLILGWWYKKAKQYSEGFYVTPLRRISSRMTARQCQDYCQNTRYCKYSQVPLGSSRSGRKTYCWNSYGRNQRIWGSRNRGGDTWRNKLYRDPPPPPPPSPPVGPYYLRYSGIWPNCSNIRCGRGTLLSFKQKCTANSRCDGFSWTKNRNWNSARGAGCLKYSCKPYQERRNGFGRGNYGYWAKGKVRRDPKNNYWYRCIRKIGWIPYIAGSYATYNASTLTPSQNAYAARRGWRRRGASYYACVQGCKGTCYRKGSGVMRRV